MKMSPPKAAISRDRGVDHGNRLYVGAIVAKKVVWLGLITHLEVVPHASDPVTLHNDNMSVINYSKDSKFHGRTKYIKIKCHFIRNRKKKVLLQYIPTRQIVVDLLTKLQTVDLYRIHNRKMSLRKWRCNIVNVTK